MSSPLSAFTQCTRPGIKLKQLNPVTDCCLIEDSVSAAGNTCRLWSSTHMHLSLIIQLFELSTLLFPSPITIYITYYYYFIETKQVMRESIEKQNNA